MSENRRNSQILVKNNIQTIKISESNLNKSGALLKRKRKRRAKIKRAEQSNDVYTETNEATVNKRAYQEMTNENESSEGTRLNRFMQNNKEKYIKLNEETEEKKENKLKNRKREKNSSDEESSDNINDNKAEGKCQQKNNKRKKYIYNKNRKNKNNMKRRNNSLNSIIERIVKKKIDKKAKKMNQQNKKMKEQNNKKFKELNNKINEQNKKIKEINNKINEQYNKIKGINNKINEQNKKIKGINNKINEQNKKEDEINANLDEHNVKMNEINEKINLLLKIHYYSDIYSKKVNEYIMNIGGKFTCLFNSCKCIYIRKICDFILEGLIDNYKNSVAITTTTFINNRNESFQLIVFTEDIKNISKYVLNLIIDFLMETKQNCSTIIHMNKSCNMGMPIMEELFYIFLNKAHQNNSNEFNLEIQEMVNALLSNDDNIEKKFNNVSKAGYEEDMDESEIAQKKNNQSDDERIKKVMSEENNNNIKINDFRKILKEKIRSNDKRIKDIAIKVNQIINPSYFYNLWKKSFKREKYKNSKEYKSFIKERNIKAAKEMNDILVKLLPKYEINFFEEDPSRFSKAIKNKIDSY